MGSVSKRPNRKLQGPSHKVMMCLERFKYPNDYSVGVGLGGSRVRGGYGLQVYSRVRFQKTVNDILSTSS